MTRIPFLVLVVALLLLASRTTATAPPAVIPGNGAGYDPHAKLLTEIRDEIRAVRAELKLMRASTGAPKPGADKRAAREQVMLRRCAGCHTPSRAEDGQDGGLILFADDESKALKPLGPRELADVADRVKRNDGGIMPPKPKPPLPAKERELFE